MDLLAGSGKATKARLRAEIVKIAAEMLSRDGVDAVTTRAVAAAAGLQAPTIYRLFGDKEGLLDAVAELVFQRYVQGKTLAESSLDPVADLDAGWSTHVDFGLTNPALFVLLQDPVRAARSPAIAAGIDILRERVHRVAAAGRLAVPEGRAVDMMHAAGTGVVMSILATPPDARDLDLADAVWDALRATIIADTSAPARSDVIPHAVALRAALGELTALTDGERMLLGELLDRVAARLQQTH